MCMYEPTATMSAQREGQIPEEQSHSDLESGALGRQLPLPLSARTQSSTWNLIESLNYETHVTIR